MEYISAIWEMVKASTRIEISMPLDRNSHIHVAAKVKPLDADSVHYMKYSVSGHCHNGNGKGKVHPRRGHEGPDEEQKTMLYSFFYLGARWGVGVKATPPGAHCISGWVGPKADPTCDTAV